MGGIGALGAMVVCSGKWCSFPDVLPLVLPSTCDCNIPKRFPYTRISPVASDTIRNSSFHNKGEQEQHAVDDRLFVVEGAVSINFVEGSFVSPE